MLTVKRSRKNRSDNASDSCRANLYLHVYWVENAEVRANLPTIFPRQIEKGRRQTRATLAHLIGSSPYYRTRLRSGK